jgi:GntR family transcriptional regulator
VPSDDLNAGSLTALLRRNVASPLHCQVEDGLRQLIRSGQVAPGTELPGEVSLAETLGLSRHTIRHAMSTLVTEVLVRRQRGRGTHVLESGRLHIRQLDQFYAFAWEMASLGIDERSQVLRLTRLKAVAELSNRLGLKDGAPVLRVDRIRIAATNRWCSKQVICPSTCLGISSARALNAARFTMNSSVCTA